MIAQSLNEINKTIQHLETQWNRKSNTVKLLAVSKTQSYAQIEHAHHLGQTAFGESYLQEALPKIAALKNTDIEWHFIGPIQKNKTRGIAESFSWVHSVDRDIIAQRLNDQRPSHLPPLNVCIQVNISQESSKSGILAEDIFSLTKKILLLPKLILRGLMTIPEPSQNFTQQRIIYGQLRKMLQELNHTLNLSLDTLSMGMSADYPAAIAEGATIIRVGSALFGQRV